jgi:hypothetical protein
MFHKLTVINNESKTIRIHLIDGEHEKIVELNNEIIVDKEGNILGRREYFEKLPDDIIGLFDYFSIKINESIDKNKNLI